MANFHSLAFKSIEIILGGSRGHIVYWQHMHDRCILYFSLLVFYLVLFQLIFVEV
jgi:hypothetical protein